jgi:hypothetical protein
LKDGPVAAPENTFSLLDDPLMRLLRALHLAPRDGFRAPRRALLGALVTWLPIVAWAAATGRLRELAWSGGTVRHLVLHFRCLVAIPLLILSEPIADRIIGAIVGNFPASGLILDDDRPAFARVVRSVKRLRDSRLAWSLIVGLVLATTLLGSHHALAAEAADATLIGFGNTWATFVVRPLFLLMLLAWLWRLLLTWNLFVRIARLDLQLVPSHPDRVGGLGFVELQPAAFSLVVFTLSGVVCASVAEQIVEQQGHLAQFQAPLIALVVLLVVVFLCPLTAFGQRLRRTKMLARFQYGTLAGRHVRGLHRRWVEGLDVGDDPILSAPEIGPAADVATLYELAARMRPLPIALVPLVAVLLPAVLPLLPVATLEIPLKDILAKVLGMLT